MVVGKVRLLAQFQCQCRHYKTHIMKINYQHPALQYHDPITGEYNEDINEDGILNVSATYEICHQCNGHGCHFRSDLDENALVEGMRKDGDEDGIESYYGRSFDQVCDECDGRRVVANPMLPAWAENCIYNWYKSEREYKAICRAERSVGA